MQKSEEYKKYVFKHRFFCTEQTYLENEIPDWLTCKENRWFFEAHVLTLGINESVDTDFQKITRIQ